MSDLIFTFEDGSEYLCHYGVLGMKWGVRKDRIKKSVNKARSKYKSITPEQKKRIAKTVAAGTAQAAFAAANVGLSIATGRYGILMVDIPASVMSVGGFAVRKIAENRISDPSVRKAVVGGAATVQALGNLALGYSVLLKTGSQQSTRTSTLSLVGEDGVDRVISQTTQSSTRPSMAEEFLRSRR